MILNSFPRSHRIAISERSNSVSVRHDCRWGATLAENQCRRYLEWTEEAVKHYYLYHLFLHELGHINEPDFHARNRREGFAEAFALHWAARLGKLCDVAAQLPAEADGSPVFR